MSLRSALRTVARNQPRVSLPSSRSSAAASFFARSQRTIHSSAPVLYTPAPVPTTQSQSPHYPVGVTAALAAESDPNFVPRATILSSEMSLKDKVYFVTGGHQGLGLEMAESLAEAGGIVYCLDLFDKPDETWLLTKKYIERIFEVEHQEGEYWKGKGRLEYRQVDVTNQKKLFEVVDAIAAKEGRLDGCIAAAGILREHTAIDYPGECSCSLLYA